MSNGTLVTSGVLVGLVVLSSAPIASPTFTTPACTDLVRFGQDVDMNKLIPLNQVQSRLALPAAYMSPRAEQTFGKPALTWSQQDLASAVKVTGDCVNAAKQARKAADIQALTVVWQSLAHVRSVLGAVAATEQRLDQRLQAFLASEPSRPMLASLAAVASVRDGKAESLTKADQALKEHAQLIGAWHPVHSHAQYTLALLRDAPEKSWQQVFPLVDKRIGEVRQWVIDDAKASINATPESPEGLKAMAPALARTKAELAKLLSESDLAGLDKAAETRRNAIEDGMVSKAAAAIDAAPANAEGLGQLQLVQASPLRSALSPPRAAALDAKLAARRAEIGKSVTDDQIKLLERFPNTMAGLRELDDFKNNTARGLEALAGAGHAVRFREAAAKRATRIGEEAFPAFRKALADMPATDQGLAALNAALTEVKGPIAGIDASMQQRYQDAATKRRDEIVAAVAKEDAQLAKLPLSGSVYIDEKLGAKFEFRDRTRVYISLGGAWGESPGEYEVDGDRVIIRSIGAGFDDVLRREGAWLRGHGYNFKRQPGR